MSFNTREIHSGDSCCCALGGDRLTNQKVLRVHSSTNTAHSSKCVLFNKRKCLEIFNLVLQTVMICGQNRSFPKILGLYLQGNAAKTANFCSI